MRLDVLEQWQNKFGRQNISSMLEQTQITKRDYLHTNITIQLKTDDKIQKLEFFLIC